MAKLPPNGPRREGILRSLQLFVVHEDHPFFKVFPTSSPRFLASWSAHDSPISTYGDAILVFARRYRRMSCYLDFVVHL